MVLSYTYCSLQLIADSKENLQKSITKVNDWCKKWRLSVYCDKSNIVHFRPKKSKLMEYIFKYGSKTIDVVQSYKYLSVFVDEYLEFDITAKVLSGAAGRAIGKLFSVYNGYKGMGYKKLYKDIQILCRSFGVLKSCLIVNLCKIEQCMDSSACTDSHRPQL